MKLFKIDFTNTIGDYFVTIPTDSEFLIGLSNGDADATVELYEGSTKLTPLENKIGAYTCYRFKTTGTPARKLYKGIFTKENASHETVYTQTVKVVAIVQKMSVAYVDFEGETPEGIVDIVSESGKFLKKTKVGNFDYYISDASIDIKERDLMISDGGFVINDANDGTVLYLYADLEEEQAVAEGVLKAEDLTINNPTIDNAVINYPTIDGGIYDSLNNLYVRTPITVKINGVDATINVFANVPE